MTPRPELLAILFVVLSGCVKRVEPREANKYEPFREARMFAELSDAQLEAAHDELRISRPRRWKNWVVLQGVKNGDFRQIEWVKADNGKLLALLLRPRLESFGSWQEHARARHWDFGNQGFGGLVERDRQGLIATLHSQLLIQEDLDLPAWELLNATSDPHLFFANDFSQVTLIVWTFDTLGAGVVSLHDAPSSLALIDGARKQMSIRYDQENQVRYDVPGDERLSALLGAAYQTSTASFVETNLGWKKEDGTDAELEKLAQARRGEAARTRFLEALQRFPAASAPVRDRMKALWALGPEFDAAKKQGWTPASEDRASVEALVAPLRAALTGELRRALKDQRYASAGYYAQAVRVLSGGGREGNNLPLIEAMALQGDDLEKARAGLAHLIAELVPAVATKVKDRFLVTHALESLDVNSTLREEGGLSYGTPEQWFEATEAADGRAMAAVLSEYQEATQKLEFEVRHTTFDGLDETANRNFGEWQVAYMEWTFRKDLARFELATLSSDPPPRVKAETVAALKRLKEAAQREESDAVLELRRIGESPYAASIWKNKQPWNYRALKQTWSGHFSVRLVCSGAVQLDEVFSWQPPTGEFISNDPMHNVQGKRTLLYGVSGIRELLGHIEGMASSRLEERISSLTASSIAGHLKRASKKWSKADLEIEGLLIGHFLLGRVSEDQRPLGVALNGGPSFLRP